MELLVEDGASDDDRAAGAAARLVREQGVDLLLGGIFSSTRQAIMEPAVVDGETLYIYPEQYEGQEHHPLLFCTGTVPTQQVEPLIPWLMQQTGARTFYLPSADYIWPRAMNRKVHEVASANGGRVVGEEYFPIDHADWGPTIERIDASDADVVFNATVPPGAFAFLEALSGSDFIRRGGHVITTYVDENVVGALPAEQVEGLYGCIDYYQSVSDPFSRALLERYDRRFPDGPAFSAGSGATGIYRGLKLWEAAVAEAGTADQAAVVAALDHAAIAEGPGGPAAMVPGQHHVRLNAYIAQVQDGTLEVVERLGAIDPGEQVRIPA